MMALICGCQQNREAPPETVLIETANLRLTQEDVNQMIGLSEVMTSRRLTPARRQSVADWQSQRFSKDPYGAQMILRTSTEWLREIDEASGKQRKMLIEQVYQAILQRRIKARLTAAGQSIPADAEAFAALADVQMNGFFASLKADEDAGDPWALILVERPPLNSQIETVLVALHEQARQGLP